MKIKFNKKGFTLIELLVVMVVFIIVIIISADAFNTILKQSAKIFRSEESNIEGVIGLEMMRHDLQQMGYGLFTENMVTAYTGEATVAPASTYNEATFTSPPRAIVTGNNLAATVSAYNLLAGTDYLAIKGTSVGRSKASHRWTYLRLDASGTVVPTRWASNDENFVEDEDEVLLLRRTLSANANSLAVEEIAGNFHRTFRNDAFTGYSTNYNRFVVYGLGNAATPRMPYNRSDYFVARPSAADSVPSVCAPNTGILYKTLVTNSTDSSTGGKLTYMPVLDCVADMQVVLMWDLMSGAAAGQDGSVDTTTNADGTVKSGPGDTTDVTRALTTPAVAITTGESPAAFISRRLKGIKIHILAQNGRRDPGYTSPSPIHVGDQTVASNTMGRNVDIVASGWQNYRWKLYQIIVRPKNLTANQ